VNSSFKLSSAGAVQLLLARWQAVSKKEEESLIANPIDLLFIFGRGERI